MGKLARYRYKSNREPVVRGNQLEMELDPTEQQKDDTPKAFKRLLQAKARIDASKNAKQSNNESVMKKALKEETVITLHGETKQEYRQRVQNEQHKSIMKAMQDGQEFKFKRKLKHQEVLKMRKERKKKNQLEQQLDQREKRSAIIGLSDVTQAPPTLSVKPKAVFKERPESSKIKSSRSQLSPYQKELLEKERLRAIELYRLKKQRS